MYLTVSAGTDYDNLEPVKVNDDEGQFVQLNSRNAAIKLAVRIRDYKQREPRAAEPAKKDGNHKAEPGEHKSGVQTGDASADESGETVDRIKARDQAAENVIGADEDTSARALPDGTSGDEPIFSHTTSKYFDLADHKKDQLSIQFSVVFAGTVDGDHLVFGNDFDNPIRDLLPYGFSVAFNAFKYWIDPSVQGDVYADKPYLYGTALTSINTIRCSSTTAIDGGSGADGGSIDDPVVWPGFLPAQDRLEELGSGDTLSREYGHEQDREDKDKDVDVLRGSTSNSASTAASTTTPAVSRTSADRRSYYLVQENRQKFEFIPDMQYDFDFFTSYLTMGDSFAIKLPGFNYDVGKYCGSQPLRYVLKDMSNDTVFLVVQFDLHQ